MSRRTSLLAVAPVAVALAIAGCGGSSSNSGAGSGATAAATSTPTPAPTAAAGQGQVIKLSADPGGQLRFNTSTLKAKAGKVTLRMTNPSSAGMDHGVSVEGNGVTGDGNIVSPGGVSTVTVTLKKGTYTFFCPVPGHREAGMTGTLTVS